MLGDEFLRLAPPGISLAVGGEAVDVPDRQKAHGLQGGSQPLPFLLCLRHQPGGTFDCALRRLRLILIEGSSSLAPVAFENLKRRRQGLSSASRQIITSFCLTYTRVTGIINL